MKTWSWVMALVCSGLMASADIVFCETGDQLHGKVISVDEKEVRLRSTVAGELKIPREKVTSISFRDFARPAARPNAAQPAALKPAAAATRTNALNTIDPAAIARVQQDFLATATPEAQAMYRDMVQGFMSGKLSVQDLRNQAQAALNQLNELGEGLEDEDISGILGTYGSILKNFLQQTGGGVTNAPSALVPDTSAQDIQDP